MTLINWGILGCGWVARDYVAPGIISALNARLVALSDPDLGAMQAIELLTSGTAASRNLDEFLRTPDLDAVYIATPNHLHRPLTEAAARAGKHVLCEKPMATTADDAEAMIRACRDAGVQYGTAFDQRFQARSPKAERSSRFGGARHHHRSTGALCLLDSRRLGAADANYT